MIQLIQYKYRGNLKAVDGHSKHIPGAFPVKIKDSRVKIKVKIH